MTKELRPRSLTEILQILKHHTWLIVLPTLTIGISVSYVVLKLPNLYESTTLLVLKPPKISEKVVQSLSTEDMSQRIQAISQEVLSRSSLEPMILKYGLFESERQAGVDMALIVERMRQNIKIEIEKTDNEKIPAFRISYRDRSPEAARNVAAELASKFIDAQIVTSAQSAEITREFIEQRLAEAKKELDEIEKQRLEVMSKNVEALPESSQGLIAQLEGLRKREETLAKEKETLIVERGRLNDSLRALNSQARLIEDFSQEELRIAREQASKIEDTPAYAQLIQKRAELTAKLENLKLTLKDKHPEVIETKNQIEKINEELEALRKTNEKRVEEATKTSSRKVELQKKSLEIEKQKIESQIKQIEDQLKTKDAELIQNAKQIEVVEAKINMIPSVKLALETLNNQYQTAKATYDELLRKRNEANLQVERESSAQGEKIEVVDPANLPKSPVNASKRYFAVFAGFVAGAFLSLFLVIILELPKFFRIQNVEDVKHYTGLQVLACIPPLLTQEEILWKKRFRSVKISIGILISLASIPILVFILQASRIFEKFVS
ncbi:MAG: hypothetical protein N2Z23_00610 [Pyrinomonadaceae bacterium]|nr:hypothetical protein [Pyrinomonadaceae bacterium]MCX7638935.1 hypothetical protein [Pyrinomonadaceae bacterium]MDW8304928.1 hypothetical protein [Acidobacteriota bacterium]